MVVVFCFRFTRVLFLVPFSFGVRLSLVFILFSFSARFHLFSFAFLNSFLFLVLKFSSPRGGKGERLRSDQRERGGLWSRSHSLASRGNLKLREIVRVHR